MASNLRTVVENDVFIRRKGDKYLTSIVSNAFNNIAAKSQYIGDDMKNDLIFLTDVLGLETLTFPGESTVDLSAQIEISTGEIYYMMQSVVNAAVPDNLQQLRPVKDIFAGREQISQMLSIIGGGINLTDTSLSDDERAWLYFRLQKKLAFQTEARKENGRNAAAMAIHLAQKNQDELRVCKTCNNINSTKTEQLVTKNNAANITNSTIKTNTSAFQLTGLFDAISNSSGSRKNRSLEDIAGEDVSVSAFEFTENVYMYDTDGMSSYVTSNVLRIDVKTPTARVTPGCITFEQDVITPAAVTISPKDIVDDEDASEFAYHRFIYGKASDNFCLMVKPVKDVTFKSYDVYVGLSESPSIKVFHLKVTLDVENNWQTCVDSRDMTGHTGSVYYAVHVPGEVKEIDYNLTLVTLGCLTWNEMQTKWETDKCETEWKPSVNRIVCNCKEVTDLVFANSFFVAPNTIDFATVFLKFSPLSQAAVLGALSSLLLIYIVAVLFLIGLDRRDQLKWGVTPLRDNTLGDSNYYLIKIMTGMRRGAGTTSRIAFVLTGAEDDTGPREMFDGIRKEFSTGSIMSFFMATKQHLGPLEHLYIWHDNQGDGDEASWYLNQVVVYDVETKTVYTFVAEKWLSVETEVDTSISVTVPETPVQFESRFFYHARDRLSESHMWVSILYRPQTSTFTRIQRASCALVYICLTMIANAMYFDPGDEYESPPLVQAGPFRFTAQQIFISIVCALITTPPVMLLIFLFKRTKRRPPGAGIYCSCCCSGSCCRSCSVSCWRLFRTPEEEKQRLYEQMLKTKMLCENVPEFSGYHLPWWCIYFAWALFLAGTIVPAFFVLLYSMQWGKQKSEEWLTCFLMSMFESMLLVDPFMVVLIAFVLACIFKTSREDKTIDVSVMCANYRKSIGDTQDNVSSSITILKRLTDEYRSYVSLPRSITKPLKGANLERVANIVKNKQDLMAVFQDILLNMLFMFIIFSIAFSNRDDRSYQLHEETINQFVTPWRKPHLAKIKTQGDMYTWLNVSVIPSLFPEFDINGSPLQWSDKKFIAGYNTMRLGPPRLRQLRAKNGTTCNIPYIGNVQCFEEYSIFTEEEEDFCIGWQSTPCNDIESAFNVSVDSWSFTSAVDIWGLPLSGFYTTYGGGGYIAQFDVGRDVSIELVNEMFRALWVDRQTRAVFFEFTLYSPSTNMFIYNVFLIEFPQTGGAFTTYWVYPIRVYTHVGAIGTFTLCCEVIFVIYLVVLLVKLCIRIYQKRMEFFSEFWQVYELVMFSLGVTSIAIFAIRLGFTNMTINKYKENIKYFVNFSHIVFWDQILVACLSILVFMATLRFLEVFATSKKVSALVNVFRECGKDLFWYGTAFLHMFLGFSFLGYLLFGSRLLSYMSVFKCLGTLFISIIGKSKFTEINEMQPLMAKIFFICYILTIVFFALSIFLSILGASIDSSVQDAKADCKEDLFELLIRRVKTMFTKPDASRKSSPNMPSQRSSDKINRMLSLTPPPFQMFRMEDTQTGYQGSNAMMNKLLSRNNIEERIKRRDKTRKKLVRGKKEPVSSR
ncbi:polycystic kidney disease protein 1-like 2 [Mya arenaria]|uniref:polycystic kidney disease protein 1-like 2 n=1 Tax=Mya arenaria TaxID=6604 RepID=UPI0022E04CF0|nr:polycystic kidney disease protein 1-like 2 [Mya arenaria]